MGTVIGIGILVALCVAAYIQIPPEPPENVEARKRYGKAPK